MIRKTLKIVPLLGLAYGNCAVAEAVELKTENDKINYSVGYRLGSDFKRQGVEMQPNIVQKGIEDATSGGEALMTEQEMRTVMMNMANRLKAEQMEKMKQQGAENLKAAEAFLAENAKKEGVKTLDSGLQYKVIAAGEGKSPQKSDKVTVHYRGTLIDGSEFDSSHSRGKPATFGVDQVIPGWTEALQLMKEGDKWELYMPPKLGYGALGGGKIPPNSALIFEVELISVN
jgi:FKBP-type peptidyl-prolyl cis-trans isomerase FklB